MKIKTPAIVFFVLLCLPCRPVAQIDSTDSPNQAPPSPIIESVFPEGDPLIPFPSDGDLWLNTWAEDDYVYSTWGDGLGVAAHTERSDCGIARFTGAFPLITAEERCYRAPTSEPAVNDKPSSLLYLNGRLYGLFHSPMHPAWIGYLAHSDDLGVTWTRVGFHQQGEIEPLNSSPWNLEKTDHFICLFFINMGKNYRLNTDGYVYALSIGQEYLWFGGVYLARVQQDSILNYSAWRYLKAVENDEPLWSAKMDDGMALPDVKSFGQGSAMYHEGIKRYLFLTRNELYDAPRPWGPWTLAGQWTSLDSPPQWQGGYQPGIVAKDTGPDHFWFTISGQNPPPYVTYRLHLGKMKMKLRPLTRITTPGGRAISQPQDLVLSPNYPNPFNPATTFSFHLFNPGRCRLAVFDLLGRQVAVVLDERLTAGDHQMPWRAQGLQSGIYLARLIYTSLTDGRIDTRLWKITLLR